MGVGELIEQIRGLYVSSLRDALSASDVQSLEPVALADSGEVIRQGVLKLPSRHDGLRVCVAGVAEPLVVNSEGVLGFEDVAFDWGGDLKVCLTPFCWDFAEFEAPNSGIRDLSANLVDWFERWFNPLDKASVADGELGGLLHSLSDVRSDSTHSSFQVAFGSAPLACFEDLLDVLGACRVTSVTVREAT